MKNNHGDRFLFDHLDRRRFLKLSLATTAATLAARRMATRSLATASNYVVGIGKNNHPYVATHRAITACGEWPALNIAGKTVIIKPNLVSGFSDPEAGIVTHVEVTRAVIDRALADGAAKIILIETSPKGAHFDSNGYGIFRNYDPFKRIKLVDLGKLPDMLTPVPNGSAYAYLYTPKIVTLPNAVFISIGKLKTHQESFVSLSNKNLFGLPSVTRYISSTSPVLAALGGRFALHDRGLHQAIVDINLLRPTHFAIIDGSWGMEGQGPLQGNPVRMDVVLAGRNSVAVDRAALEIMEIPQNVVLHLAYAAGSGLGPADLSNVTIQGDPVETTPFQLPVTPPIFQIPIASPATFRPLQGETTTISVTYHTPSYRVLHIVKAYPNRPHLKFLRTLEPLAMLDPGTEVVTWDGRAEDQTVLPPGTYGILARGYDPWLRAYRFTSSISWVNIID